MSETSPKDLVSIFQLVLCLQFAVSITVFILATIGISIGYSVASFFGLSLLQALITVPGVLYLVLNNMALLAVYNTLQVITGACEIYWLFVMIFDGSPASKWLGLGLVFLSQVAAIVAFFFRKKMVNMSRLATLAKSMEAGKSDASANTKINKPNMSNASLSEANNSQRAENDLSKIKSPKSRKSSSELSRKRIKARAGTPIRKPKITYPNDSLMDPLPTPERSVSSSAEFVRQRELSNEEN